MKKRILSMLLAICLIVGMLPMTTLHVHAARSTRSIYIFGIKYQAIDGTPAYGTIDELGKPSDPVNTAEEPANWNIKFGYEKDTDTVPTLTLKNATLGKAYKHSAQNNYGLDQYSFYYNPNDLTDLYHSDFGSGKPGAMITYLESAGINIVAEGTNTIYSHGQGILLRYRGGNLITDADSSLTVIAPQSALRNDDGGGTGGAYAITLNGNFDFQLVRPLKITRDSETKLPVLDTDGNPTLDASGHEKNPSGYPIYAQYNDVVIAGGNVNVSALGSYIGCAIYIYHSTAKANGSFLMTGGNLFTNARAAVYAPMGTAVMEGGKFVHKDAANEAGHRNKATVAAVHAGDGKFVIKGGEVLMYESRTNYVGLFNYYDGSTSPYSTTACSTQIDLTQYEGDYIATASTKWNADGTAPSDVTTFDPDYNTSATASAQKPYRYFHVVPHTHENTIHSDETHHWTGCDACGTMGEKEEHTYPETWTDGKKVCTGCDSEIVCTHTYDSTTDAYCNTCGAVRNIEVATCTIYIFGQAYTVSTTTRVLYSTIDPETGKPDAPVTDGTIDWQIKFGYVDPSDTVPTLVLNNATLGKAYKASKDTKFGLDQYGFAYDVTTNSPADLEYGSMITAYGVKMNLVAVGENYIYSHCQGILAREGMNLITDEDSSLTVISRRTALRDDTGAAASGKAITLNGNFTFQNVHALNFTLDEDGNPVFDGTVKKTVDGNPIYVQSEDVVIAGGNVNIFANADYTTSGIYTSAGNFKMTGGNLFIEARAAVNAPAGTVVVEDGKFTLKSIMCDAGHRLGATAIVAGADGKFVIKGGEVLLYESMNRYGGLFSHLVDWNSEYTNSMVTAFGTANKDPYEVLIVTKIDLTQYNGTYVAIGSTDDAPNGTAPANSTTKTWTAEDEDLNLHLCYFHVAPHTHEYTYQSDADGHWTACDCGDTTEKAPHDWESNSDEKCDTCGYERELHTCDFTFDTEYDADGHWGVCSCGETTEKAEHVFENNHDTACDCGYTREPIHTYNTNEFNDTHHWTKCECGVKTEEIPHEYKNYEVVTPAGPGVDEVQEGTCECGATDTKVIEGTALPVVAVNNTTGAKYATMQEAIAAAKIGETVELKANGKLTEATTLIAGVKYVIPEGITLTVKANVTAQLNAVLDCAGLIVVESGKVDISELIYDVTFLASGGKLTIKNDATAVMPNTWKDVWTPNNDATEHGDMLVNCETGAIVIVAGETWELDGDAWEHTNHAPEVIPAVGATCTSTGWTEGSKCSYCGEILTAPVQTSALGHLWTDDHDTECDRGCGETRDPIHDFSEELTAGETTHWYACSGCSEKSGEAPHVYENYTSNNDAAIGKNETETGTCVCGAVHTRDIPDTALTAVAKVGNTEYADLQEAVNAANGGTVVLLDSLDLKNGWIIVDGITVTLDLAGNKLTGSGWDGVIHAINGANVTITGNGAIVAKEAISETELGTGKDYAMVVFAEGANTVVTIKNGTFSNENTNDETQEDMIYVKYGATVNIEGGTFNCATPKWTLNSNDTEKGTFVVTGGTFYKYNPAASATETPVANFLAEGLHTKAEGDYFTVCTGTVDTAWTQGETTHWNTCSGCDAKFNEATHVYENYTANNDAAIGKNETETGTCVCGATDTRDIPNTALTAVAKVGDTEYADLQAAVNAANGGTVVLLDSLDLKNGWIIVDGITVTLDLAGNKLTGSGWDGVIHAINGANVTITGNGAIVAKEAISETELGVLVGGDYAMVVYAYGEGTEVTIVNGTFSNENTNDETQEDMIYVKAGATINIEGGTFNCATPKWTLNSHDTQKGTFVVTGGTFYKYNPAASASENPIANFLADGYHAKVEGDYFTTCNGAAEVIPAVKGSCTESSWTAGSKCSVCGEILVAPVETPAPGHSEEEIPAVEGSCTESSWTAGSKCSVCGEILVAPVETPAPGHDYDDGVVTVEPGLNNEGEKTFTCQTCGHSYTQVIAPTNGNAVAKIGSVYYESLADAYEAAVNGDTIILLRNKAGAGLVIKKSITIDFNGKTYTVETGVGSYNSCGFQILEEAGEVTLMNGTLQARVSSADQFYMLVQNYADLTVTDMTLIGLNLDKWALTDGDSYVLSNNSGNVTINGNTTIKANNDGKFAYALDSCKFKSYDAPVVTIEGNVVIDGNMELSGGTFNFNGGTYNGTLVYSSGSATKAESVTVKTAENCCWNDEDVLGAHVSVGATCTTLGSCAHCGEVCGELAAHTEVVDEAVAVTCTTNGLTEGKHCSVCGKVTVAQQTIAKTGHDDVVVEVVKPTDTERGYTLYKCNNCGRTAEKDYVSAVYNAVARFDGSYFKTLADALAAAEASTVEGDKVIEVLRGSSGAALVINTNVTIDLGGYTYTVNDAVNGAAVCVNGALTLKNGTLQVRFANKTSFDTLIENNGNLDVQDMTLRGIHLYKSSVTYIVKNADGATVTATNTNALTKNKQAIIGF